ncbi:putative Fe-S protein [Saccharomonospora marina XMU15]|uniref:Putative Fe-S protein n=1 Tax=Saccharomonospora marina XMU15 TaxID=882083 RepID=H5WZG7_9PSEU|nr:(2Fe-2S)-binding protein [Saccharomonospora marina]EHR49629.1 putative Fe-S protein [Saccharomonospora marina XMU15]
MSTRVRATVLADEEWLAADLERARRLYGRVGARVLGTIRWYSASSVLVAPALEPFVHTGIARDPSLSAVTLDMHPDGRYLDSESDRNLEGGIERLAEALGAALDAAISAAARVSGATARSLWAVATDSVANRMLWAGSATAAPQRAMRLAEALAEAVGGPMPRPRFEFVGERPVVRRCSCCLIYEAELPGVEKCASCPRQPPQQRAQRLRTLLG